MISLWVSSAMAQPASEEEVLASPERKIVKAVEVEGNKTISIATILSKIKTRVGQEYLETVISDDLKRLYNTGYFSDVRVDRQPQEDGLKLIIYLEEKSIIEEVTFSKTRHIKSRTIQQKIETKVGKFLDKKLLKDDVDTIKELYESKGFTNVEVEVETFVDDVTNKASLHFIIREGQRIRVTKINILGNSAFPDKKIIRVIKTRPKWWFFTSGYLKEDVLAEDMERIKSFYEQKGYIDAEASHSIDPLVKGTMAVNIEISEGKRYSVGSMIISGNEVLSEKEIQRVMEFIQEGNIFSREKLSVDLSHIRTLYFDRGYIFANVIESTSLDPDTGKVEVKIDVEEGDVAYIEKVKIQGNTRTRDIVIRRELNLYPGERFDGTKLRKSKDRLSNLGYFEDVSFDIEDTESYDRKNLLIQVKEAKTGSFSFGGGFSTIDQLVGFIQIEQRNFDFMNWPTFTGAGQYISLRAEAGSTKNNLVLSFTEPWLFDYPISGGFDLFLTEKDKEEDVGRAYDEGHKGGVLRFGKRFGEYVSGGVSYRLEQVKIDNLDTNVSSALQAEAGKNTVSTLGFTLKRDTRDSQFSPTTGFVVGGGFDIAGGALGGDKDFYRVSTNASYYVPLHFKSVLEFRGRAGWVDSYDDSSSVPIFERFFAGGSTTIRGYEERGVGPLDPGTNDPVGGESMLIANIEYTIPIIEFIKLAVFFDSGNVWGEIEDFGSGGFKSGMGVGARIKTPIGPINLDYGYPLNDEPGEEDRSGKFYFSVSRGF